MDKEYCVYILANKKNGTLYVGMTSDIIQRIWEHKNKICKGFTARYDIDKLVYLDIYQDVRDAIHREKQIKKWPREWKLNLIERENLNWIDLYPELITFENY